MKNKISLLCATVCALAFSSSFEVHAASYIYKAQNAVEEGSEIALPDTAKAFGLRLANKQGVTIGDKPTVGEDGKSLVFSGRQQAAFVGTDPIPTAMTGLKLDFSVFLNPEGASIVKNQTIFRHPNWEVRCDVEKGTIAMIVWHGNLEKKYSAFAVPIQSGVWQRFSAVLEGNVMTISVNGAPNKYDLPGPIASEYQPARLSVGAAIKSMEKSTLEGFRPFCGSLADINITLN